MDDKQCSGYMQAPESILKIWNRFDSFPMDTLVKVWHYDPQRELQQRTVEEMRKHRAKYGITGNCFDLALWLWQEFRENGVEASLIGHDLHTEEAHVAVVARSKEGFAYLCDLGDQWLQPILIDSESRDFRAGRHGGFFPAADIEVLPFEHHVNIFYHRPNGKRSSQSYDLSPVDYKEFLRAADLSQRTFRSSPLIECRLPFRGEVAHWELEGWQSQISTSKGIIHEPSLHTLEEWGERVHIRTGYDRKFLQRAMSDYFS
ncbi:hypothetical protein [Halobacillus salinus]|uniref:hypothetical protein n=1 Tax=Halobacillus salinus TaxID=192814 RepID=UPI0020CA8C1D|nr:hypothetical protein [Halobacillus salinus]